MRAVLVAVCRLLLRVFFRRIEVVGRERVPEAGPVMFTLNHPNGLIDPLFILCLSTRPVSFLAKAPLFRTPVVGMFVRAFDCLPVYRKQDGNDTAKNREIMTRSVELLGSGNAIAIFPEGTSHSDPKLKPLRTGAARIALSASAEGGPRTSSPVRIVPVGLHYLRPETFRSDALLYFGEPLPTDVVTLDEHLEPPPHAVAALTEEIGRALGELTLQAETVRATRLAHSATQIVRAAEGAHGARSLAEDLDLQRRLAAGYERLQAESEVIDLARRIDRYEHRLQSLGLPLDQPLHYPARAVGRYVLRTALAFALLLPLAVLGFAMNYPTYRAIGMIAFRFAESSDVTATMKMLGGFLLFPLTWLLWSIGLGVGVHWGLGLATLAIAPWAAFAALKFSEMVGEAHVHGKALVLGFSRRGFVQWLERERNEIRDAIVRLGDRAESRSPVASA